ncbi:putative quinol monooxygenase [Antrihabitans stalactiti]|uniref:Antibiotic biosynthesis monooxygenase n=1 Tax=Antrihabitans stalactiti TaxID=2584121 RepID=A0A848KDD4_9NOCA|nr:putative quinol monooxygenase [Antrihabitans stalactiti]NMN94712.1 antibiotic biosynthesis monooxygenase [Antrihabitans stalactiti]
MTNLNVVAVIQAKPDTIEEVRAVLADLVRASRAEPGCVSYDLNESLAAPGTFVAIESWRSQEDLAEHAKSQHMRAALSAVGDRLAAAPAVHPLTPVDI